MLLIGKPSISMGHLYHGYVSHNQRVDHGKSWKLMYCICTVNEWKLMSITVVDMNVNEWKLMNDNDNNCQY